MTDDGDGGSPHSLRPVVPARTRVGVSVVLSWGVVHTVFTLRYARLVSA